MNSDQKKRIMYISGEDFYFFCYSILIILDGLNCKDGRYLKDYRKLSFLISLTKNEKLLKILTSDDRKVSSSIDLASLNEAYLSGLELRSEILKLLFSMEGKGLVELKRGKSGGVDVSLVQTNILKKVLKSELFKDDKNVISCLKRKFPKMQIVSLSLLLDRIFKENGVKVWAS